jgi:hypothetical protein
MRTGSKLLTAVRTKAVAGSVRAGVTGSKLLTAVRTKAVLAEVLA